MKAWWRGVRPYVLAWPIYTLVRLIGACLKIETVDYERVRDLPGSTIFAGWHGRTFTAAIFFRGQGMWTIISQSRDGELQNRIFTRFGFRTIRGSSGRGGVKALIEAIKVLKGGGKMAFTPDGPRGPTGIVQDGILMMAQKSGAALVPVGVSAKRRRLVGTWDRYLVPGFFTRAIMIYGEPITIPPDATPEEFERVRAQFQWEMHRLESEAEVRMGHPPVSCGRRLDDWRDPKLPVETPVPSDTIGA